LWGYRISLKPVDPKQFGLNPRISLVENSNSIAIVIDRKSRIIMKDGKRILDQSSIIMKKDKRSVFLLTSAPVCGKTKLFLSQNNISIKSLI